MIPKRSRLPRSRADFLLWLAIERDAAELEALLTSLRGEEGDLWLWCGEHAQLVCQVWSRAATIETIGFDPGA